tara:strand:- start:262 stop:894 length:633 start_codon:yes stop_codon:yes gene_type:complete
MLSLLLALAATPPAIDPEFSERFERLMARADVIAETLEADDSAQAYARGIVDYLEAIFGESPYPHFSLHDRDGVIAGMAHDMEAIMSAEPQPDEHYDAVWTLNAFRQLDEADAEPPFCHAGANNLISESEHTDPQGHVLNFRVCSIHNDDIAAGVFTRGTIFQLSGGVYYVVLGGSVEGSDAEGAEARLPLLEPAIARLSAHTVIEPGEE